MITRADPLRRALVVLAGLLAAAALSIAAAPVAAAHTELVGSDPADGSTVTAAPTTVTLTFTEDLVDLGAAVAVTGPDGSIYQVGVPVVEGPAVISTLKPLPVAGAYTVAYRVVSADGHPVEGQLGFTVPESALAPPASASARPTTPPPPAPPSTAGPGTAPTRTSTSSPSAASSAFTSAASTSAPSTPAPTGPASSAPTGSTATAAPTSSDVVQPTAAGSGTPVWLWVGVAAAVAAVVALIVVLRRRSVG